MIEQRLKGDNCGKFVLLFLLISTFCIFQSGVSITRAEDTSFAPYLELKVDPPELDCVQPCPDQTVNLIFQNNDQNASHDVEWKYSYKAPRNRHCVSSVPGRENVYHAPIEVPKADIVTGKPGEKKVPITLTFIDKCKGDQTIIFTARLTDDHGDNDTKELTVKCKEAVWGVNGLPNQYFGRPGEVVVVEWAIMNKTMEVQDLPDFSFSNSAGWDQIIITGYAGPGRHVNPGMAVKVAIGIRIPANAEAGDKTVVKLTFDDPLYFYKTVTVVTEKVPTVSEWGLIILALLLMMAVVWSLWKSAKMSKA